MIEFYKEDNMVAFERSGWMVEIGEKKVTVGPFTGQDAQSKAFAWYTEFLNELKLSGQLRSILAREIRGSDEVFYDVDMQLGPNFASPSAVARDIECYEHCHDEAALLGEVFSPEERDRLAREFDPSLIGRVF